VPIIYRCVHATLLNAVKLWRGRFLSYSFPLSSAHSLTLSNPTFKGQRHLWNKLGWHFRNTLIQPGSLFNQVTLNEFRYSGIFQCAWECCFETEEKYAGLYISNVILNNVKLIIYRHVLKLNYDN
jgi:hypothetical protein